MCSSAAPHLQHAGLQEFKRSEHNVVIASAAGDLINRAEIPLCVLSSMNYATELMS